MHRIVAGITSLAQHLQTLAHHPAVYRPVACPHCATVGLWRHGYYYRKAHRRSPPGASLNPVPIPRFRCRSCCQTCSRLPECVPARRWYYWALQYTVLLGLLDGASVGSTSRSAGVDRRTVGRWWNWLRERDGQFAFFLRSRFPEWGRRSGFATFWRGAFQTLPLGAVMAWLDRDLVVP